MAEVIRRRDGQEYRVSRDLKPVKPLTGKTAPEIKRFIREADERGMTRVEIAKGLNMAGFRLARGGGLDRSFCQHLRPQRRFA